MNFTFDYALGREAELYNDVVANSPSNAALILLVLRGAGLEADATLRTYSTVSGILGGTSHEVANTGYARKKLDHTAVSAYTVDTTLHQITLTLATQTFSTISAGDSWAKLVIAYGTTSSVDSANVPVRALDLFYGNAFVVPNGSNIVMDFSAGFVTCQNN